MILFHQSFYLGRFTFLSFLRLKIKRGMEIFTVLIAVFLAFVSHPLGMVALLLLFLSPWWPLAVIYSVVVYSFDLGISSRGGRRSTVMRNSSMWQYFRDYFPIKLLKTSNLDPTKNYIFGCHPHGIMPAGAFGNFGTEATGFKKLFPGIKAHLLTMKCKYSLLLHITAPT